MPNLTVTIFHQSPIIDHSIQFKLTHIQKCSQTHKFHIKNSKPVATTYLKYPVTLNLTQEENTLKRLNHLGTITLTWSDAAI